MPSLSTCKQIRLVLLACVALAVAAFLALPQPAFAGELATAGAVSLQDNALGSEENPHQLTIGQKTTGASDGAFTWFTFTTGPSLSRYNIKCESETGNMAPNYVIYNLAGEKLTPDVFTWERNFLLAPNTTYKLRVYDQRTSITITEHPSTPAFTPLGTSRGNPTRLGVNKTLKSQFGAPAPGASVGSQVGTQYYSFKTNGKAGCYYTFKVTTLSKSNASGAYIAGIYEADDGDEVAFVERETPSSNWYIAKALKKNTEYLVAVRGVSEADDGYMSYSLASRQKVMKKWGKPKVTAKKGSSMLTVKRGALTNANGWQIQYKVSGHGKAWNTITSEFKPYRQKPTAKKLFFYADHKNAKCKVRIRPYYCTDIKTFWYGTWSKATTVRTGK